MIASPTAPTPPPLPPLKWLRHADLFLCVMAVALAGLTAAYVSRNSDQWLHFAAGRDLLDGRYILGTDPFAYTTVGRYWANPSWLYDVIAFNLYQLDDCKGKAAVLVKAVGFAMALGIVMLIRRKGTPGWPWWLVAMTAVIVAAPYTELRPAVASAVIVALFLLLLLKGQWKAGSWKLPVILALLTALWSNLDGWFILSPVILLLAIGSEAFQKKFLKGEDAGGPALGDLSKAFGLCLLATLVNPHHIHAWQLPWELGFGLPEAILADPQFARLRLSPLSKAYRDQAMLGRNLNGLAFAVLFVAGSVLLALSLPRPKLPSLLLWVLWVLFGLLAVLNVRFILLFAVAAVPLIALPLSEIAAKLAESKERIWFLLASVSRLIAVPMSLLLMVCAWPGWLQPAPSHPAFARRVALGVEADPAFERGGWVLQDYRETNRIPEAEHGVILAPEFADHVAWFAPAERVAVNSRFAFHAPELPALVSLRELAEVKYLDAPPLQDPREQSRALGAAIKAARERFEESMKQLNAVFVLFSSVDQSKPVDFLKVTELMSWQRLAFWHVDGRVMMVGPPANEAALFQPVRLAFRSYQAPLPAPVLNPAPERVKEQFQDFLEAERPVPLEALDAQLYAELAGGYWNGHVQKQRTLHFSATAALTGWPIASLIANYGRPYFPNVTDDIIALHILAHRSARQAAVKNPDHPLSYYVLGICFDPEICLIPGVSRDDAEAQRVTAFRRYLDRMPLPGADLELKDSTRCIHAAGALEQAYFRNSMYDFYRDAKKLRLEYQKAGLPKLHAELKLEGKLDAARKNLDDELEKLKQEFDNFLLRMGNISTLPPARRLAELQKGLPQEAIKYLESLDLNKEFGSKAALAELLGINLRLKAGLLEEAVSRFDKLDALLPEAMANPGQDPELANFEFGVKMTFSNAFYLAGDYAACNSYRSYLHTLKYWRMNRREIDFFKHCIDFPESLESHALIEPYMAAFGAFAGQQVGKMYVFSRLNHSFNQEFDFLSNLALNSVLNGDMTKARRQFEEAMKPYNIPTPPDFFAGTANLRYLNLMDDAEKVKP